MVISLPKNLCVCWVFCIGYILLLSMAVNAVAIRSMGRMRSNGNSKIKITMHSHLTRFAIEKSL